MVAVGGLIIKWYKVDKNQRLILNRRLRLRAKPLEKVIRNKSAPFLKFAPNKTEPGNPLQTPPPPPLPHHHHHYYSVIIILNRGWWWWAEAGLGIGFGDDGLGVCLGAVWAERKWIDNREFSHSLPLAAPPTPPPAPFSLSSSSLVKSRLAASWRCDDLMRTWPSFNWMKLRRADSAAINRAIFLLLPWPLYFWPSTWQTHDEERRTGGIKINKWVRHWPRDDILSVLRFVAVFSALKAIWVGRCWIRRYSICSRGRRGVTLRLWPWLWRHGLVGGCTEGHLLLRQGDRVTMLQFVSIIHSI